MAGQEGELGLQAAFRGAGADGPLLPREKGSVLRRRVLVWQNGKAVCMAQNGVARVPADFSPIDVKRAKSDAVCRREGLFGVCGRAVEHGSFASDNASEVPFTSELFALKYLKIATEIFTEQPAAKPPSSSYCTGLSVWKSLASAVTLKLSEFYD